MFKVVTLFISWGILNFSSFLQAQNPIDVSESTLKIAGLGEEVFYYGFAEGDQLLFNFEEVDGKELKEVEIIELPSSSKFMDYKTKKVENKKINIERTGIYKFRFSNSALLGRICKFKIQRIPVNESLKNFNTSVYWKTIPDTTYTPEEERYLIRSDTLVSVITNEITKISSRNALSGNPNKTIVQFILPEGTIAWSYYLGVGAYGQSAFSNAESNFLNGAAQQASKIPGYGPMAALALYGIGFISQVQGDDHVKYSFIRDYDNAQLFQAGSQYYQFKEGDAITEASQMKSPLRGQLYLGLMNTNMVEPIDVTVKITAVLVKHQWGVRNIKKMSISSHKEAFLKN